MKIIQISTTPGVYGDGDFLFPAIYALTDTGRVFVAYDTDTGFKEWKNIPWTLDEEDEA